MNSITQILALYIIYSTLVYTGVEFFKSIWKIFSSKKIKTPYLKIINFIIAYYYAWQFDIQIVIEVFDMGGNNKDIPKHLNYFILATLMYVGAKNIFKYIKNFKKETKWKN